MTTTRHTTGGRGKRGRPRSFDTAEVLDRSVDIFWRSGFNTVTTRHLENEIGISQSSIYNTFGSKSGLFTETLAHYRRNFDAEVLSILTQPNADHRALLSFLHAIVGWISHPDRPGCLVLNHSADHAEGCAHSQRFRRELRQALNPVVASFTDDAQQTGERCEVILAAIMGLNCAITSGADDEEMALLTAGVIGQVNRWIET
ncbi:MAG: TetR/AcrR family transcriptional regulator [Actinomycetota bacterium]